MSKCSGKNKARGKKQVAVFSRNRWQLSAGMGGKFQRIEWQVCTGICINNTDNIENHNLTHTNNIASNKKFHVFEDFEENITEWVNRSGDVGASLKIVDDKDCNSKCLKLMNLKNGGNFASTITNKPFNVEQFPIVSFDYRIGNDVNINFFVKVENRWYDVEFTDTPKKYERINITKIGRIKDVSTDNRWHHAEFNLFNMLREKTGNTIVSEMIMADWDSNGYMVLAFGDNKEGASYYIDNFAIVKDTLNIINNNTMTENPKKVLVDDFNDSDSRWNLLNGRYTTFSNEESDQPKSTIIMRKRFKNIFTSENKVLSLEFRTQTNQQGSYCGWVTQLNGYNASNFTLLSFQIKGKTGDEKVNIYLNDGTWKAHIDLENYIKITKDWQKAMIPLHVFKEQDVDISHLDEIQFVFEWEKMSGQILIDNIMFEANSTEIALKNHAN